MQEEATSRNGRHGLWSYDLLEQVCAPRPPATSCSKMQVDVPKTRDTLTVSVVVMNCLTTKRQTTLSWPSKCCQTVRPIVAGASWAARRRKKGRRHAGEKQGADLIAPPICQTLRNQANIAVESEIKVRDTQITMCAHHQAATVAGYRTYP